MVNFKKKLATAYFACLFTSLAVLSSSADDLASSKMVTGTTKLLGDATNVLTGLVAAVAVVVIIVG